MNEVAIILSPTKYYEDAKTMLEKKDFVNFLLNIGKAEVLAGDVKEALAQITFLKAKGFTNFKQYHRALESIEEALKYNSGEEAFKLKKFKGVALGYLGELRQAIGIFKELSNETRDIDLLVEIYTNITWANLLMYAEGKRAENLEEAKIYLDLIHKNFNTLPGKKKMRYYNNSSVYFCCIGDYDKAIQMQEKALDFCEESDLPEVYNNLASLHLESDKDGISVIAKEYIEKAEVIGDQYDNKFEMAKSFYNSAMIELREEEFLKAIDSLYLAFDFFKDVEAYPFAFDSLIKINELLSDYKVDCLKSMKESLKAKLKGTPYHKKI